MSKDLSQTEVNNARCSERLSFAVTKNATIHKLIDSIQNLGCKIPDGFFSCRPCEQGAVSGGFVPFDKDSKLPYKPQVVMCDDNVMFEDTFQQTVVHELIHAYDVCRSNLDFSNCQQHACTEIRAAALSGECNILQEISRGNLTLVKGYQDCVKRRAALSVSFNLNCKGKEKEVVNSVFTRCFADSLPFDSIKDSADNA